MFNPKYKLLITGKCFPEEKFICLGTQLILIVNTLKDFLPKHIWYGADVDAMGKGAMKSNINDVQLNLIGTNFDFIRYCAGIDQFIWGVFLCIDNSFSSQKIEGVELETEDQQFRSIPCNGILLEIRTFDTTFFEIYAENEEILKTISKKFNSSELVYKD